MSSRVLVLEDSLTEGFEKQEQALQLVGLQLQRLATDQNELLIKVANCQDDLIEKVDVASLEPLRAADRELMAQLTKLGEELLSKMAEMAAKDHLTQDDINHLVTQYSFENAGERTQRQLSVLDIGLTRLAKMIKVCTTVLLCVPLCCCVYHCAAVCTTERRACCPLRLIAHCSCVHSQPMQCFADDGKEHANCPKHG